MKTEILKSEIEVFNALAGLRFRPDHFQEVISRMVTARNSCTKNHPLGAGGTMSYLEGTCRLREIGIEVGGWEKNDDLSIPSIYNPELNIKIAVCNTDDGTGIETALPQNRNKKRSGVENLVRENQTVFQSLWDEANVLPISSDAFGTTFWYLCVYADGDVVRAELSCPTDCEGGYFKFFKKRIILIGADGTADDGVRRRGEDDGKPDFDIVVTRKQG